VYTVLEYHCNYHRRHLNAGQRVVVLKILDKGIEDGWWLLLQQGGYIGRSETLKIASETDCDPKFTIIVLNLACTTANHLQKATIQHLNK